MRPAQNRAVPDPPRPTLLVSRAMSALTAHGPFASHSTMEIVDCKGSPTATHQHFRWSEPMWSPPPESNRRPHPYHSCGPPPIEEPAQVKVTRVTVNDRQAPPETAPYGTYMARPGLGRYDAGASA